MSAALLAALVAAAAAQADAPADPPVQPPLVEAPALARFDPVHHVRLITERDDLLRENPSVGGPVAMLSISGGAAMVSAILIATSRGGVFTQVVGPSSPYGLSPGAVIDFVSVIALLVAHATLGVLGAVFLPRAIQRRDAVRARLGAIELELTQAGVMPRAPVP